ncbi:condensation domain-containing protein, partial [Antrihabitans stalagmiti]|uniref:condensation domain-containing protein n=1 Tax=Antrihabitans stalagmiti TaxID=2799499 RepID=UPI0027DD30D6
MAALGAAFGDVVGRHEALRTVFDEVEGVPFQRVVSVGEVSVPLVVGDVESGGLAAAVEGAARYRFDLAVEIPVRVCVLRVSEVEHVVVLVVHHIAGDGASMAPLARDLAVAYAARVRGVEPGWVPLPVQYADYTLWQREVLGEESDPDSVMAAQFGYWREVLAGVPEVLELPVDRPRPAVQSFAGAVVDFVVEPGLRVAVGELARSCGATVSMVLQSALAVLLHRVGGGVDIAIGGPVAGRTDEALSDLVGIFVNTWVLRVDVSGAPRFEELLGQVRGKALSAYENQDAPFERLVELLNPGRSTAYHPLFQVSLALQNNPLPRLEFPGLSVSPVAASTGSSRFDLFFTLTEQPATVAGPGAITGLVEYSTDLFDEVTVRGLAARFVRVLEAVCADPSVVVGDID